ncbi:MAG: amidase family protein [Chloroflexota bacterium]
MGVGRYVGVGWSLLLGTAVTYAKPPVRRRALDLAPFRDALAGWAPDRDAAVGRLLTGADITRIGGLLAAGELTAEELALHHLARIARLDPVLHAIIELDPTALDQARAADARRREGAVRGPLDGIPVTVKDNIETAGPMHTTAGAMALIDHVAHADAPIVTALRSAGAALLGKTNLSELAGAVSRLDGLSAVGGRTVNPHGRKLPPGGSSSGSAAAVAAGLCVVSVGTETSGSLLAPASFDGVVGMKPSRDLVSGAGIIPLVRFQDSAGPLARSVADAAALLEVLAGRPLGAELADPSLAGVRVGVLRADVLAQKSPLEDTSDNAGVLARITEGFAKAGATVTDVTLVAEPSFAAFEGDFTKVVVGGLTHDTMAYLAAAGAPATTVAQLHAYNRRKPRLRMPGGQLFLDIAVTMDLSPDAYEAAAMTARERATAILDGTFAATGADVLVSVSNRHSALYATAGFPAISVPAGLRASGMPVGVTIIGKVGEDAALLRVAAAFEAATKLRVTPPDAGSA